jgi:cyanate lyase
VAEAGLRPLAVIVRGEVVRFRDRIRWFDRDPEAQLPTILADQRTGGTADMTRDECTKVLAQARLEAGLSYQEIADKLDRHVLWTAAALMGQCSMDEAEAGTLVNLLGLEGAVHDGVLAVLQQPPMKGAVGSAVPVDPLLYRFHEVIQVYGPAIKAVIHEKFGDGIMSAIDFEMDIERVADPKGDRVKLTFNGKFLPYRKW